jgi:hypothetical protein
MHKQARYELIQDEQREKMSHQNQFDLGETLSHQSCLVANDNAISILLVLEDPLGPQ